jgi:hypothetical protein
VESKLFAKGILLGLVEESIALNAYDIRRPQGLLKFEFTLSGEKRRLLLGG